MDLLIVTLVVGRVRRGHRLPDRDLDRTQHARRARWSRPVLDLLQTMPTFVYLMFVFILFGIGAPNAVVCTRRSTRCRPIVRIAGFGIRDVSPTAIEATDSLGQSTWQRLRKVQVPMARPTIILGLNQTILAALSIAIIAGYVNGPGLGKPVLAALDPQRLRRRAGAGSAHRADGRSCSTGRPPRRASVPRRWRAGAARTRGAGGSLLGGLLVPVAVAVWYSRYSLDAAVFPENDLGAHHRRPCEQLDGVGHLRAGRRRRRRSRTS